MEYRMTDATFEDWIGIDPIDEVSRLFLQGVRNFPVLFYLHDLILALDVR